MKNKKERETFSIEYTFVFEKDDEKKFEIILDAKTLDLIQCDSPKEYPEWTLLDNNRCSNCTLKKEKGRHCPVSMNIHDLVTSFSHLMSHEIVTVVVKAHDRTYTKEVPIQKGLSSLMGIYMVTNECPVMSKLKHMVRFHLPFASPLETVNRILSSYLLAQYFRARHDQTTDWDLVHLKDLYQEIRVVNQAIMKRMVNLDNKNDAHLNALVCLDTFAMAISYVDDTSVLGRLESVFSAYLD
jgi:hypothetical protein